MLKGWPSEFIPDPKWTHAQIIEAYYEYLIDIDAMYYMGWTYLKCDIANHYYIKEIWKENDTYYYLPVERQA